MSTHLHAVYFLNTSGTYTVTEQDRIFDKCQGETTARWSSKMERGVGGEVEMHSSALSKSRFNRLLLQAGEGDGEKRDEGGDVQRDSGVSWFVVMKAR